MLKQPLRRRARSAVLAGSCILLGIGASPAAAQPVDSSVGTWRTWVLASGDQFRLPPPPGADATRAEAEQLRAMSMDADAAALARMAWWNAAAPSYRWNQIAIEALLAADLRANFAMRHLAVLHTALADGMIAAWDSKYAHNRAGPMANGAAATPSYPDEHAVAGTVAAAILGTIFPRRQGEFEALAAEASRLRLLAGAAYPSDVAAGVALGRSVAAVALERAARDGSAQAWTGTVPTGPGLWSGTNPIAPQAATWTTWLLASPSEIRPPPPAAHDSAERAAEMTDLRAFVRTPKTSGDAFFWEYGAGGQRNFDYWGAHIGRLLFESGQARNAPRAARTYALVQAAMHDAGVACWDAKYTYWTIRPHQLDPAFRPLFTVPNHPSYPSAHSCFSVAATQTLAGFFPADAAILEALARQAGQARIAAGVHYWSDVTAGERIGQQVAARAAERARTDGAKRQ
ncbi:phosphatase PAP2 family protein [Roseomonas terrae]|uniref:Phosphatase PAP2 family protein n=1 Tax=Neoroseomonas terrae TaxID=424799 RepID=A0ABS5EEX1_9PROT|nr:phosphatase PAP2 family protein [Neoroseomonas terrae]MBR0649566.1 phosphatase PAP2 family protein [Neoroseomonas terrae]